jgi:hypothetical protein
MRQCCLTRGCQGASARRAASPVRSAFLSHSSWAVRHDWSQFARQPESLARASGTCSNQSASPFPRRRGETHRCELALRMLVRDIGSVAPRFACRRPVLTIKRDRLSQILLTHFRRMIRAPRYGKIRCATKRSGRRQCGRQIRVGERLVGKGHRSARVDVHQKIQCRHRLRELRVYQCEVG